tara:strand:+ start:4413 stop:4604 length:192 start_codon:yes stop_codon:yes gene_type:complete
MELRKIYEIREQKKEAQKYNKLRREWMKNYPNFKNQTKEKRASDMREYKKVVKMLEERNRLEE